VRQYLIRRHFQISTDQKSLKELLTQTIQTPEQQKWAAKLQGFTFDIFYKPGKTNLVADALSRQYTAEDSSMFLAITTTVPKILQELRNFYLHNTQGKTLLSELLHSTNPDLHYTFRDGLRFFKNRIYIPDLPGWRDSLLTKFHSSPMAGHSGAKPTLFRLIATFQWPGIHKSVRDWVQNCSICQHNKYLPAKKSGLLQPLDTPQKVWEDLTMDFIRHLPNSFGHTGVWVICDRLTKFVHFIALPTQFTARDLALHFSTEVCRLHGVPNSIISDRDPIFLSNFWKELFRVQGTTLKFSSAYHPKTEGQTEVVNRSLETYLRCFSSDHPTKWYKYLHLAEYWYNTSFHSSIKMSPFQALYGRSPPTVLNYVKGQTTITDLDESLEQRQQLLNTIKENLKSSKAKMEIQANKKRKECTFFPGNLVLLRLQPYRQQTVQRRISPKLAKRYFGPFMIRRRIGAVAYELELPPTSKIHPVIHVSQLRAYHGDKPEAHFSPIPQELEPISVSDPTVEEGKEEISSQHTGEKTEEKRNELSHQTHSNTLIPTSNLKPSDSKIPSALRKPLAPFTPQDQLPTSPGQSPPSDTTASSAKQTLGTQFLQPTNPVSYNNSTPFDPPTIKLDNQDLTQLQSHHSSGGPLPIQAHTSNLEDKVSSALDSNDRRLIPKRNINKPVWTRDFILK
jgi:hypothetical protein